MLNLMLLLLLTGKSFVTNDKYTYTDADGKKKGKPVGKILFLPG